uniref:PHD-type domain-containing protein n=1 Tax=Eutreptiella gymnastica TaxID=73025 RepID=A0A7S1NRK7_9EUGL
MPHDPRNQQQVLEYYLHSALSYLARLEDSRTKMYSILLAYRNDSRGLTRARRVLETIFSFLRPTAKDRPLALDVRLGVACTKEGWNWHAWMCPNAGSLYAMNHVVWLQANDLREAIHFLENGGHLPDSVKIAIQNAAVVAHRWGVEVPLDLLPDAQDLFMEEPQVVEQHQRYPDMSMQHAINYEHDAAPPAKRPRGRPPKVSAQPDPTDNMQRCPAMYAPIGSATGGPGTPPDIGNTMSGLTTTGAPHGPRAGASGSQLNHPQIQMTPNNTDAQAAPRRRGRPPGTGKNQILARQRMLEEQSCGTGFDDAHWEQPVQRPKKAYCLCRGADDGEWMVACASCDEWFHGHCVGITEPKEQRMVSNDPSWLCPPCERRRRLGQ